MNMFMNFEYKYEERICLTSELQAARTHATSATAPAPITICAPAAATTATTANHLSFVLCTVFKQYCEICCIDYADIVTQRGRADLHVCVLGRGVQVGGKLH